MDESGDGERTLGGVLETRNAVLPESYRPNFERYRYMGGDWTMEGIMRAGGIERSKH